jgi:hypothetical protein
LTLESDYPPVSCIPNMSMIYIYPYLNPIICISQDMEVCDRLEILS